MTAVEPTTDPESASSRREMLCGLVVALLAPGALAAACSDGSPSGSSGSTPTGGGAPTGGGGSGGTAGGTTLAALTDVPEGGGLIVDKPGGGKLLLIRSSGEQVKAYDASCTHQGSTVSTPKGNTITCPTHGSQFDAATGDVKKGPARAPLSTVPVSVQGGNVTLA